MANVEYKKELKHKHIDNSPYRFTDNLDAFLKDNQNIKIIQIITHKPYHISIIYEELTIIKK